MGFFEEFLSQHVTDEADRSVLLKYPALRENVDRAVDLNAKNQRWFALNWDEDSGKTVREKQLEEALQEKEQTPVALPVTPVTPAAGGEQDMTFEEIENQLKAKGYMSAPEVKNLIDSAKTEVAESFHRRDLGAMVFTGHVANLTRKHHEEFGDDLDVKGFAEHISQTGASDPVAAYNQYVSTKRAEATAAKLAQVTTQAAADAERFKQEGIVEGRRQAQMELAQNGGMPADQGGNGGNVGWMQQRQIERTKRVDGDGNQIVPGGRLGDGSATSAIMAQLAKDRAEGKTPAAIQ